SGVRPDKAQAADASPVECRLFPELVWRQPGWNVGAIPGSTAPAIRILCGPHYRYVWRAVPAFRPRPFRLYERARGGRIIDRLFHAGHQFVSGSLLARPVQALTVENGPH